MFKPEEFAVGPGPLSQEINAEWANKKVAALVAENEKLKAARSLNPEELWIRAWCAAARRDGCGSPETASIWARKCLQHFNEVFGDYE